uniref:DUF7798 domain-containing protein n=1 Tax=Quercus lobata TaxID=97700 RepID=A0A7N2R5W6_QUELO
MSLAAAVAQTAAKSISDMQIADEDTESSKDEEEAEDSTNEKESEDDKDKIRKAALDKLEKASDESIFGQANCFKKFQYFQGLKVLDNSVENLASGAWQALRSAWRGGSDFVHKIEHSAVNLAESIQHGGLPAPGSVAPSILEICMSTGKAFTAKGMQVVELVGKETIDLLITETGIEVEKNSKETEQQTDEDQLYEEVTFDRCFYIYGGPEQLEVQQIFSLTTEMDGNGVETDKGKKVETGAEGSDDEMKKLHDSSVSKAADMAVGFTNALAGVAVNDMIQRTAGRIDSLHSEGVHRLSEMCCFAVSQLLMLGKSILSNASKVQDEVADEDIAKIDWPEDSVEKAKIIRTKAQSMTGYVEAVSNSFITGWLSSTSSL